ncbi:class I SAM-dependent methyltransferase [Butyrivibrio sp. YAB3001]|uniref:class I SAM-dependent methyltransferase n=1 Tax=Butyrivibrio sp. YAB3001 TaxID=1520812 RepID=UPI0008F61AE7|nr:class I SAM-dependent methyltransferase [Butyrivibrio sp. YAB3001]SFC43990.1 tRNA (adenine22-N1)-methyltransferase [Butyrivibrio sp. YAB3001]
MDERNNSVSARMSNRLITIANMLGQSSSLKGKEIFSEGELTSALVADVGCDHGYISIYLVQSGIANSAIAMDVRKGPLAGAENNIREFGLGDKISTRLSDGLKELKPYEADAAVIAGMGGKLMIKILQEGRVRDLGLKQAILQPQSDICEFREYLRIENFVILDEEVVFEDGKYYFPMRVAFLTPVEEKKNVFLNEAIDKLVEMSHCDRESANRICNRFGEHNILKASSLLRDYLRHGEEVSKSILETLDKDSHMERIKVLEKELSDIRSVLCLYEDK